MNTSKHLTVIPGASENRKAGPSLSRDAVVAMIVVTALLMGIGAGAAFQPQPGTPAAEPQSVASQPSGEFVYFPSQYVNQGTEIPEPVPTF
jgi:hypothetical protein